MEKQRNSNNSSFEKVLIEESPSSDIVFKASLPPPPNLQRNKRLRKVTEQESDLFDSNYNLELLKSKKTE